MAYGVDAPFGLRPSVMNTGAPWNGQTNTYLITSGYNTSLFIGDPVAPQADGSIGRGVTSTGIIGVFMGCQYVDANGNYQFSPYWPANTVTQNTIPATAFVVDDPSVLFDIQVTTSNAGTHVASVSQADLNANASFVFGTAGSTVSGQSGASLDAATIAVGGGSGTLSLKILRVTPAFTNQAGTLTSAAAYTGGQNILGLLYNNVLVQINNDNLKGGTGTVGV